MYVGVVLNPRARKNRGIGGDRAEELSRLLGEHGGVVQTDSVDELPEAVARLLPRATHLVSDGGDGALHWLINEVRQRREDPETWPTFIPTNGGTIDFIARKVGVRGSSLGIIERLAAMAAEERPPPEMALDTLRLRGERSDGTSFHRLGFALAAGGVGNRFFDKYYADPAPSARTIAKVLSRTIADWMKDRLGIRRSEPSWAEHLFSPTPARVTIDGAELDTPTQVGLHAGSIDVRLGFLHLFPFAKEDGVLHFQAGTMRPGAMIAKLPRLIAGRGVRGKRLVDQAGHEMLIEALGDELLRPIIDGERYEDLTRLEVDAGPRVRIARVRA